MIEIIVAAVIFWLGYRVGKAGGRMEAEDIQSVIDAEREPRESRKSWEQVQREAGLK